MWVDSKYNSRCIECAGLIFIGDRIFYDGKEKKTYCHDCGVDIQEDPHDDFPSSKHRN